MRASLAAWWTLALTFGLAGCIDGARLQGELPADFLGDAPPISGGDADATGPDDADAEDDAGDGDAVADTGAPDTAGDTAADADTGPDTCTPGEPGCLLCGEDADCAHLDDGDLCNGRWVCGEGTCVEDATPVTCDDAGLDGCHLAACDPASGKCHTAPAADGLPCDDEDACTVGDRCEQGACLGGPRLHCDDGNPCTEDSCDGGACKFTATVATACDDGNPCTTGDKCLSGKCTGSGSVCDCADDADCAAYDDGNACNGSVACVGGKCRVPGFSIVTCEGVEPGPCEVAKCSAASGLCEAVPLPDGSGCDDADPCTVDDACQAGSCVGTPRTCDDPSACATAACDPATGVCVAEAATDGSSCEDGTACLTGATCAGGACLPTLDACACTVDADCATFEDGDACNGTLMCAAGRCVLDPASIPSCEPDDARCQTAACDPATGACVVTDRPNGWSCSDGNPCTTGDSCAGGACFPGLGGCGAGGTCTAATCHPFAGCRTLTTSSACVPTTPCFSGGGCGGGTCQATTPTVCEPSGACKTSSCDPGTNACVEAPIVGACDDGNPCTVGDTCAGGACAGKARVCDDGNPCTTDSCDAVTGECKTTAASGLACDDGNPCTSGDVCAAGACKGTGQCACTTTANCAAFDDDDPCNGTLVCTGGKCVVDPATVVTCDPVDDTPCLRNRCQPDSGACEMTPSAEGAACDPGDPCATGGACEDGACVGEPLDCDDGNPCTTDACDPEAGCTHTGKGGPCDDGNPCTTDDACTPFPVPLCGGENTCDCAGDGDCAAQDDGNACNGTLKCVAGKCEIDPATVVVCAQDANPCTQSACDPGTGACVVTNLDGAPCQDGKPCTVGDTCQGGTCKAGAAKVCSDGSSCTTDACNPTTGNCQFTPTSGDCNDGNPCSVGDTCQGGDCIGSVNTCSCSSDAQCDTQIPNKCLGTAWCGPFGDCQILPGSAVSCASDQDTPCAFSLCEPSSGACVPKVLDVGAPCDDKDACTLGTLCTAEGTCEGVAVDCDDGNACTIDTCDPVAGCVHTPADNGAQCDDQDQCTTGTVCISGKCGGGVNTCFCTSLIPCPKTDNPCLGTYTCAASKCVKSPAITCPGTGKEPCVVNTCDPASGTCKQSNASAGVLCDDKNPCTLNDRCGFGTCFGDAVSCDDGNPCTSDKCTDGACVSTPLNGTTCDDGDPCTKLETCQAGVCGGGSFVCACTLDSQCTKFDNGNLCDGLWKCIGGTCQPAPGTEVTCTDANPSDCVDVACTPATGLCTNQTRPNGAACSDGSICTVVDKCTNGQCAGEAVVTCTDPDPDDCVDVACDPKLGVCVPRDRADGAACDDANACTTDDRCVAGGCQGELVPCDDGNPCTDDVCSALSGCKHPIRFGPCDDGNQCTTDTFCSNGKCSGGKKVCPCTGTGDCAFLDDGNPCNGIWVCSAGQCQVNLALVPACPDPGEPCQATQCDPATGGCVAVPLADDLACDDGDPCTAGDRCVAGACVAPDDPCDDGNACTVDACNATTGACTHTAAANGAACDDGDPCNGPDACTAGKCTPGTQTGACACVTDADCAAFDDDDLCNGVLSCEAGACKLNPGTVVKCPVDPSGCTVSACDPASGQCVVSTVPDGVSCNDGDRCTADDRCEGGACGGTPVVCKDSDPCTADACDPLVGCVHPAFSGPCDDANPCTVGDTCANGTCTGTQNPCDDGNACTTNGCSILEGCRNLVDGTATTCNDGDPCTTGDSCSGGSCIGVNTCSCATDEDCSNAGNLCLGTYTCQAGFCRLEKGSIVKCPADDTCGTWACNPGTGVCEKTPESEGLPCDDASVCTTGDTCQGGVCTGAPITCTGLGPCVSPVCLPKVGCQLSESSAACDDGDPCSVDDRCLEGTCAGSAAPQALYGFDDGDLAGLAPTSTGAAAGWYLAGVRAQSAPLSLTAYNPTTGKMNDANGAWSASVTLPPVLIPAGSAAADLVFALWMDVGDNGCDADILTVTLDGAAVDSFCDTAGNGFVTVTVSLNSAIGDTVEVGFTFDTVTAASNAAPGVFIDDVTFDWSCPLK